MDLKKYVASIENYPKEGIIFRDITPLMNDGEAYKYATEKIVEFAKDHYIDIVVYYFLLYTISLKVHTHLNYLHY